MGGFLQGLNSFAGGLASGINTGSQMRNRAEEMRQRKEEHDWKAKDRKTADDIDAGLAAIQQDKSPRFIGSKFDDPGFQDEASARAAAQPKPQPQQAMPTDPLAPLPEPQKQAPQLVTVRDPITQMYHNVSPDMVREPTDSDYAKEAYKVYASHGKITEGMKFLHDFYSMKASKMAIDREEMVDSIVRNWGNPKGVAKIATDIFGGMGSDFEVQVGSVDTPDGRSAPLLLLNVKGSNAPPFPIGGGPGRPTPSYDQQLGLLTAIAKGDIGAGVAQLVAGQATVEQMASTRQARQFNAEEHPLRVQALKLGNANTAANTANTQANTARTVQGIELDRNQDTRLSDELYGTAGGNPVFGAGWTQTDHPGSPRDGGRRQHQGWDYSGLKVGTPIQMEKDGEVVSQKQNNGKAGNEVTVRYDDGTEHTFMHLQGWHKQFPPGTKFKAGQAIAYAGNTGNATTKGTDQAVLHVQGSAGQPGRGIPSKVQREKDKQTAARVAQITQQAISDITKEGIYEPGSGEFNAAVRTRVAGLSSLYGIGPPPGTGREIPFKRK